MAALVNHVNAFPTSTGACVLSVCYRVEEYRWSSLFLVLQYVLLNVSILAQVGWLQAQIVAVPWFKSVQRC